jgi:hypothetical protein
MRANLKVYVGLHRLFRKWKLAVIDTAQPLSLAGVRLIQLEGSDGIISFIVAFLLVASYHRLTRAYEL